MKKRFIALLLAGMLLGCTVCAQAVSWGPVTSSTENSPFSVEVIKLGVRTDAKGAPYYIESKNLAAYPQSTVYYAIKLTLPSYMDANAHYKRSDLQMGSYVT
ncbi:MAG: hypothetical protein PHC80_00125, partial [Eubacteriales bacterium]|nr:hypothetical protein [Eubacteriales bacterium]